MVNVEELLNKLVGFNTVNDKENMEIMDYIQNILCSMRISYRKKR